MKALLFGSLTIDENTGPNGKYTGPGGAVYFIAKTFENLYVYTTIISSYGDDFPKKYLPNTRFIPELPEFAKTLIFKNTYAGDTRVQSVENYEQYLNCRFPENIKDLNLQPDIVVISPIINNINFRQLTMIKEYFPKSFFVLLPQGLYRDISGQGEVFHMDKDIAYEFMELFNFICLSQDDVREVEEKAKTWSKLGPMVIITRANKDASLYLGGENIKSKPFYVPDVLDPTGAGDIFAAAFSFAYLKSLDKYKSLLFAHACAALSLRARSDKLQYTYTDIINFAAAQNRSIKL